MTRCPSCNLVIVYHAGDKLKVRTRMLALTKSGAEVVCRRCGADVKLDLRLGSELRKALAMESPPLVLTDPGKTTT
jgi:hypothetical protein